MMIPKTIVYIAANSDLLTTNIVVHIADCGVRISRFRAKGGGWTHNLASDNHGHGRVFDFEPRDFVYFRWPFMHFSEHWLCY